MSEAKLNYERRQARKEMREELYRAADIRNDREQVFFTLFAAATAIYAFSTSVPPYDALAAAEDLMNRCKERARELVPHKVPDHDD